MEKLADCNGHEYYIEYENGEFELYKDGKRVDRMHELSLGQRAAQKSCEACGAAKDWDRSASQHQQEMEHQEKEEPDRTSGPALPEHLRDTPVPFWTLWEAMTVCDSCQKEEEGCGDCDIYKAVATPELPKYWDLESCLFSKRDLQICKLLGAKWATYEHGGGYVTLWDREPHYIGGRYAEYRAGDETEWVIPLAHIDTKASFQEFAHIFAGPICVPIPDRLFKTWQDEEEREF